MLLASDLSLLLLLFFFNMCSGFDLMLLNLGPQTLPRVGKIKMPSANGWIGQTDPGLLGFQGLGLREGRGEPEKRMDRKAKQACEGATRVPPSWAGLWVQSSQGRILNLVSTSSGLLEGG